MTNANDWTNDTEDLKRYCGTNTSGTPVYTMTNNYLPDLVMDGLQMNNDVTKQPHYMNLKIQPLEYMVMNFPFEQFYGYLKGNAIKYPSRADDKNGAEDFEKCAFYAKLAAEYKRTGKITLPGRGTIGPGLPEAG